MEQPQLQPVKIKRKYTRKNKPDTAIVPAVSPLMVTQSIPVQSMETVNETVYANVGPVVEPENTLDINLGTVLVQEQAKRRPPCKKGTRRNRKTGECEPVTKAMIMEEPPRSEIDRVTQPADTTDDLEEAVVQEPVPKVEPTDGQSIGDELVQEPVSESVSQRVIKIKRPTKKLLVDNQLAAVPKDSNEYLRLKEKLEYDNKEEHQRHPYLYPDLDDPEFSLKIARRKEFHDTQYNGTIAPIEEQANKMCSAQFELLPHQIFVKNFLSLQTPYNSLFLYHGLGSGKTCSAIGIAEEMRAYMKQVGIRQRIIVVAAPNVQANFKMQLFDERRLREVDGAWTMQSCIGDTLLREVNPTNLKGLSKERVSNQIKSIINQYYVFMGYIELANFIQKKTAVSDDAGYSAEEKKRIEIQNIRRFFNNRLIIIDEVHNIRLSNENKDWKTAQGLMKIATHCENLRMLLLSATPMYNSHKEIIWLVNLMNVNDKRGIIRAEEVFDSNGEFRKPVLDKDGVTVVVEGGRELLHRKLIGYMSYVRGENPYTFPYRIYPVDFAPEHTFRDPATVVGSLAKAVQAIVGQGGPVQYKLPTVQLNGRPIERPMDHVPIYVTSIGEYQERAYRLLIETMREETEQNLDKIIQFDEMDRFGFRLLQSPLEALNIVYPSELLDAQLKRGQVEQAQVERTQFKVEPVGDEDEDLDEDDENTPVSHMVGKRGMRMVMTYIDDSKKKIPMKYGFAYRPEILATYGRIFSPSVLPAYSAKIARICEIIRKSTGIVMIYSQYIDGGIVPLALALEEMGFGRYGSSDYTRPLFASPPTEPVDALTMKPRSQLSGEEAAQFSQAKYVMITGDKAYSPQNADDIKHITSHDNRDGKMVKVIMISKAGSEGLDFKNIRQIHILEPWYNLNRIEQIVGRGVRNLSHCSLEFAKRNVEIYMHGTVLKSTPEEEAADVYVYRLAKRKADQIGQVTRVLKETAVDCQLNIQQTNFTVEKLVALAANQNVELELSTDKKRLKYQIGDRPHTDLCDYMETCAFQCIPNAPVPTEREVIRDTYSSNYAQMNNPRIMQRIRQLFREERKGKMTTTGQYFYKFSELLDAINAVKQYPVEHIYSSLQAFIENKNEFLVDHLGRRGNLINRGDIYAFQPVEISDEAITVFERSVPVDVKRSTLDMEVAKTFPTTAPLTKPGETAETGAVATASAKTTYQSILDTMEQNLANATTEFKGSLTGDRDWYKHASLVVNHLQLVHDIGLGDIVDHIIHHMVDVLLPPEKLAVVSHLYSKIREPGSMSEIETVVKEYLDQHMVTVGNRTAFFMAEKATWKLYVQSDVDPTNWTEAEPEDVRLFERSGQLSKFRISPTMFSKTIGFINMFKTGKEMVFRIKNVEQLQNNTGTNIDSYGKKEIIKRLNEVLDMATPLYGPENSKMIAQPGFSVIMEIIMRHRTKTRFQGKVWYLDPEEAMYSEITKYQRRFDV